MNYWRNSSSKSDEGEVLFPLHIEHQLKQELTGKIGAQTTRRLNQYNLKWNIDPNFTEENGSKTGLVEAGGHPLSH